VALDVHVLVAPAVLFAVGWFWARTCSRSSDGAATAGRGSGLGLVALVALMAASGYALQALAAPLWRAAFAWAHAISGTLFAALLVGHFAIGRREEPVRDSYRFSQKIGSCP